MLERHKQADIPTRRVERSEEGDRQEEPEVFEKSEPNAGQTHRGSGEEQQNAARQPIGPKPPE
jgi:hypothetical protein